jgi:hypothetical protein
MVTGVGILVHISQVMTAPVVPPPSTQQQAVVGGVDIDKELSGFACKHVSVRVVGGVCILPNAISSVLTNKA